LKQSTAEGDKPAARKFSRNLTGSRRLNRSPSGHTSPSQVWPRVPRGIGLCDSLKEFYMYNKSQKRANTQKRAKDRGRVGMIYPQSRTTKECWKPAETERDKEQTLPRGLQRKQGRSCCLRILYSHSLTQGVLFFTFPFLLFDTRSFDSTDRSLTHEPLPHPCSHI